MADEKRRRAPRERSFGAELAQRAREELAAITGLKAEGVTSLQQEDDGTWTVTVELLELSRVPETDDMLGSYEVELNEDGEMLGYRRVRRYARSQADLPQPVQGK
jgi:Gas vesicle synthesis protein GvpO